MDRTLFIIWCGAATTTLLLPWIVPGWFALSVPLWIWLGLQKSVWRVLGWFLLGAILAEAVINWRLPAPPEGAIWTLSGQITDLQYKNNSSGRLVLRVEKWPKSQLFLQRPMRVELSWYRQDLRLHQHDQILARVKIHRVAGLGNWHAFDYTRWLYGRGVIARGTLLSVDHLTHAPLDRRSRWLMKTQSATQEYAKQGLLLGLSFAKRDRISAQDWQLMRETGISHLLAISGLHIALVALLGFTLGRCANETFALVLAAVSALGYAWLAGFSLPTQRALLMLVIVIALRLTSRSWPLWRHLLWALVILTLYNPLQLLHAGFWLSFSAVSFILLGLWLWQKHSLLRIQLLLALGLMPLQVLFFSGVSILGPLYNLFLIPLFSLLVIPIVLLSVLLLPLLPSLAQLGFYVANGLLIGVFGSLEWVNEHARWWLDVPMGWALLPLWAAVFFIAWRLRWYLAAGLTLLCWLLQWVQSEPVWQVRVLDVGQGLSVLVQQGPHTLLYDTGNAYRGGFNLARAVILPTLKAAGTSQLDYLILSHRDRDHSGGATLLQESLSVRQGYASWRYMDFQLCQAGVVKNWHRLTLEFLHPQHWTPGENDDSCVLRISDGQFSLLLTGDLTKRGEAELLDRSDGVLWADLLVVAHHGSRSSSSPRWVASTLPKEVIYSASGYNPWGFPHPEVVERYRFSRQWLTAKDGQILFELTSDRIHITPYRTRFSPWYRQLNPWL